MAANPAGPSRPVAYWDSEASFRPGLYRELHRDPYASSFSYGRHKLHPLLERALRNIKPGSGVLDVGCGTGEHFAICRDLGLGVIGLEPSSDLRTVARNNNPDVSIQDGSVFALPFEDKSFDFVFAIEVLRYFSPAERLLAYREVIRVLRPGGRFFFTMSNRYALDAFFFYQALRSLAAAVKMAARPPATHFVTPRRLRSELYRSGFGEVETLGTVLGPIRIAYKVCPRWAPRIASALDRIDDRLFQMRWTTPFSGYLTALAIRPFASE